MIGQAQDLLEQRFDFQVTQLSLEEALSQLSTLTEIPISYSSSILPTERVISINQKNQTLKFILKQMLRRTSVSFKQVGSQVVLFYKKRKLEKYRISGFIEDKKSGEKLIGANIYERNSGKGASTNEYGFFSFTVTEGELDLACSYLGYETKTQKLILSENLEVNFKMENNLTIREIIVISSEFDNPLEALPPLGTDEIPVQQMSLYPKLGGETDIFRMTEFMPGVQTGADGLGGLHIRGGSTDQNLVLMDGVPVYNASHSLGIFSIFNPEAVKSMQLYKGGFPAQYTGRLSSVMDIRTKEGNMKEWAGNINLGMAAASATLEGPLIIDKASIFLTARKTILGKVIQNATEKIKNENEFFQDNFGVPLEGNSNYKFSDFNGKLNIAFSEKDKLYLSYYEGSDNFSDNDKLVSVQLTEWTYTDELTRNYNWGNKVAVLRWNHLFNNKLFLNTTLTRSNFGLDSNTNYDLKFKRRTSLLTSTFEQRRTYFSSLKDWGAKVDFDYTSSKNHHLRFGANSTLHQFRPGVSSAENEINAQILLDSILSDPSQKLWEHNIYFSDEFFIGKKLKITIGGNATMINTDNTKFDFINRDTTYISLQPRVSLAYQVNNQLVLQATGSKITQPLHLLSGTDIGLPNDLWVPSTSLVQPEVSWQGSIGMNLKIKKQYNFRLELYYKTLENIINYQAASSLNSDIANPSQWNLSLLNANNWELEVISGSGRSYGAEFQFQKTYGKTTGMLSYTYANATRSFDQINRGINQRYRFDRRHDLKIAFSHRIFHWLDFSWNWIYGTGLHTLIPNGETTIPSPDPSNPIIIYFFENRELAPNHRLDLGFNIFLKKKEVQHKWYLGVYNLYNRRNPQYYTFKSIPVENEFDPTDPKFERILIEGSVFPILPSLSYSLRF